MGRQHFADPRGFAFLVVLIVGPALYGCSGPGTSETPEPRPAIPDRGPVFTDIAGESGVDFVHFNGMTGRFYTAEVTGAGCGMLDYDNDGDLDLYLPQGRLIQPGTRMEDALFPPAGSRPTGDRLFRNDGFEDPSGRRVSRFVDVTGDSGIEADGYAMGVATGDYDNDGWIDIYVTNVGENNLFHNNGDGTFTDVARAAGATDDRWSVPAAFIDYDRDGWLDLYVGNYVEFSIDDSKACFRVTGARDYCGPLAYTEAPDRLLHNEGDGTFSDVTRDAGLNRAFGSALGVVATDFDLDGWIDIYVANDGRPNQLWINNGDGTFVDRALLWGAALNAEGMAEASMGVEAADFDGDGDTDLFMAHLLGETNTFYANEGSGTFTDSTIATGLAIPSKWATAFGAAAVDYDNDGWLDIVTANGEVRVIEEQARNEVPYPLRQPNQLFRNHGQGRFEEISDRAGEAFQALEVSRGAAIGDVDNDGDSDLLVLNNSGPAQLLRNNVGQDRHWLGLRLVGPDGRRDMLGARVALVRGDGVTLWRRVRAEGSFASAHDPRVLFGLGQVSGPASARVHWPGGEVELWDDLAPGRYTTLQQGTGRRESTP